jgi:hypothetical protein
VVHGSIVVVPSSRKARASTTPPSVVQGGLVLIPVRVYSVAKSIDCIILLDLGKLYEEILLISQINSEAVFLSSINSVVLVISSLNVNYSADSIRNDFNGYSLIVDRLNLLSKIK